MSEGCTQMLMGGRRPSQHQQAAEWAGAVQEDGTAGGDSEEEGSAEAKSESLGSDIDSEDGEEEEAASRRLNVRTGGAPSGTAAIIGSHMQRVHF